jgi:hypothetical protein
MSETFDGRTLTVFVPMKFERRGARKRIVAPDGTSLAPATRPQPNGKLMTALVRAWRWQKLIEAGKYASVREAARAEGVAKSYAAKISKMVLLAPDIVEAIVAGRADDRVMLKVLEGTLPVDWEEQLRMLGI